MNDLAAYMNQLTPEQRIIAETASRLQRMEVVEAVNFTIWNFREKQHQNYINSHAALTALITEIEKLK